MPEYLFLRIAWMKNYRGVTPDDIPTGAGSYVEQNQDGGEVNNFYPIGNSYYGYARIQMGKNLRIEKLGGAKTDEFIDGITVVLFAKNPETGGQFIVGWYKKARLFRSVQRLTNKSFPEGKNYMIIAAKNNSYLLKPDQRVKQVEGPGQTNAWYVEDYNGPDFFKDLELYMDDPSAYIFRKSKKNRRGTPWQKDIDVRNAVEQKAMEVVAEYFETRNYEVEFRHKENFGWDLEATLGKQKLLLEVKGLSGSFKAIELTPNEYSNSKINKKFYRICIVSNALDDKMRKLEIFYNDTDKWTSNENKQLKIEEIVAARFSLKV